MLNATATGNLTKDAQVRQVSTEKGTIYAIQFTIAMNEKYGDKENATFIPCTYWCKSDKIVEHLIKGKAVIAQIDWYSNNEKEGRYYQDFRIRKLEFQRGEKKPEVPLSPPLNITPQSSKNQSPAEMLEEEVDDLPF
ncbi:single-stranded DNA-binding protein [Riemerella columbina]|uniref:single-stranded DNA-binding protein n=1 Tax=Riemerella columbina TaxID=103810 RepID=UPI00037C4682|nr:single-stranded DNA-binding protein [Riemerella columbina]